MHISFITTLVCSIIYEIRDLLILSDGFDILYIRELSHQLFKVLRQRPIPASMTL